MIHGLYYFLNTKIGILLQWYMQINRYDQVYHCNKLSIFFYSGAQTAKVNNYQMSTKIKIQDYEQTDNFASILHRPLNKVMLIRVLVNMSAIRTRVSTHVPTRHNWFHNTSINSSDLYWNIINVLIWCCSVILTVYI